MREKDKNCQDNNVGNNGGNGSSKKDLGLKQTDDVGLIDSLTVRGTFAIL